MSTRTRTRFYASPEPSPLASVTRRTVSFLLPPLDDFLDRVDGILDANDLAAANPLADAAVHRTRLRDEPDPLAVPARPAAAPVGPAEPATPAPERTVHLDRCLGDLQRWLGAGLSDVCTAAGLNRGTVYAWRSRQSEPRPKTTSGVLRLHGMVASAVGAVGQQRARQWFHAGDPSPLDRLIAAAGGQATTTAVARELRRAVTAPALPAPNPLLAATLDDSPARPLA